MTTKILSRFFAILTTLSLLAYPVGTRIGGTSVSVTGSLPLTTVAHAATPNIIEAYGALPLSFEPNQGQADPEVKFFSHGKGYSLFLTSGGAVLSLAARESGESGSSLSSVIRMNLINANPYPTISGEKGLPGVSNYFIGNDPEKWRTSITTYGNVKYENVYPGIDLVFYGNQGQIEYDFIVAPGADPKVIKLGFEGAERADIDSNGDLIVRTSIGDIRQRKPVVYQEQDGVRMEIPGAYILDEGNQVSFDLGSYDTSRPLIIDPVLVYSTYLGGTNIDDGMSITVDEFGNAYVVGYTSSLNFPATPGSFDATLNQGHDVFVAKINTVNASAEFATYVGGGNGEIGLDIAIDQIGNAYVTGNTSSFDFPTTGGAFQPVFGGGDSDAFVFKLSEDGSGLIYSTFIGGGVGARNVDDAGRSIAIDEGGSAYVTGYTHSFDFPLTQNATQPAFSGGDTDAFVAVLSDQGSTLVFSTFLGGSKDDYGNGVAVDLEGDAYVTGYTGSSDFPVTSGAFDENYHGGDDAFIAKLNPTGLGVVYSSFLGGDGDTRGDIGMRVVADTIGNAYVTGLTDSSNFPTTQNAFDQIYNGNVDGFATKMNPSGESILFSTYIGGGNFDYGSDIALDGNSNIYVSGAVNSEDFPTSPDAYDNTYNGSGDAFLAQLDSAGSQLLYSSFLGGSDNERALGMALDKSGNAYLTGYTYSSDFPLTPDAVQGFHNGVTDAFIVKFGPFILPNQSPIADAGPDQAIECISPAGAGVTLDAFGSSDPDNDTLTYTWRENENVIAGPADESIVSVILGLGTHAIELTAEDGNGGVDTDEVVVIIVGDTIAPSLSLTLDPNTLWPPNHKLADIHATVTASDACTPNPSFILESITSNEPDNGLGDGDTANDIQGADFGTSDTDFKLRAERSGNWSGRIYTVAYTAIDDSGNSIIVQGTVIVPHNKGK